MDESLFKVTKYNNSSSPENIGLLEAFLNADTDFERNALNYKTAASLELTEQGLLSSGEGHQLTYGPLSDFEGKEFRIDLIQALPDGKEILCRFLSKGEKLADSEAEFLAAFAVDERISRMYITFEDSICKQDEIFFNALKLHSPEKVKVFKLELSDKYKLTP